MTASNGDKSPEQRKQELVEFYHELKDCPKCELSKTRTTVVFGTGEPDADLMFVGEAPGFHEDQQGKPFVGQAGKLLDKLLGEIGLQRKQVFIANVLKCRPPDNRDPRPEEIDACQDHLFKQIALIRPRVICTLGNFATKLLTGKPDGITKVRGTPQLCSISGVSLFLYPIFHPAAALYTPAMLETLRGDFQKLPELLKEAVPEVDLGEGEDSEANGGSEGGATLAVADESEQNGKSAEPAQMGLF